MKKKNSSINKTTIVHISDTHLGFKTYRYLDKNTSLNQRELDNYNSFKKSVNKILEIKPILVLHSGDLFDTTRPSNYTLDFAIEQFRRLTRAGIKVIILAGNHSTPKISEQSHIFKIFRHFENIYPLFKGKYEHLQFDDIVIHAVSQSINEEIFSNELKKVKKLALPKENKHILMLHGALSGFKEFSMSEFNELNIEPSVLREEFDYIALGHYHNREKINPNCYYTGSIMPLTFNESDQEKGFLIIDLNTNIVKIEQIESRPLIDLPTVNAQDKEIEQIEEELAKNIGKTPTGSVCRQIVINLNSEYAAQIDKNLLNKLRGKCLHYQFNPKNKDEPDTQSLSKSIGNLEQEFVNFLNKTDTKKKNIFQELGLNYLEKANETN